jgi:hypothetical protein
MRACLVALTVCLVAVSRAVHAVDADVPPTGTAALLAWLEAGSYRAWVPEPTVRPSFTAHGDHVRAWLNPVLVEDLRAGRTRFRKGAAMVKELYLAQTAQVVGFSVMRKVRNRSGRRGRGWYFFETFDGVRPVVRPGRGAPVCVSCHRDGRDYYLLGFQP